ncbi:DUF5805 domain-containing protein [Natrinema versiforme]|uniref:Uncharacterized protein n=1 Tax=Natrinema versiforme TaxID=88724 RepID=A0A4P8WHZ0_9EURY|nr:DUF5805 domain-containing protein [Natrinema versiforme]QCS42785.1 hypothetical protein FEJ81_10605 [Natrinema versiforme]
MASDDRTAVKTYVPQYQKEKWAEHADELEMSQSEFVRTMVQAGRSDFGIPSMDNLVSNAEESTESNDDGFQDRILALLEREGVLDWDELVDRLIDDIEEDVDTALGQLQDDNLVRYSGRKGGYVRTSNE